MAPATTTTTTSPLPPPVFPSKLTSALPGEAISHPSQGVPDEILRTPRVVRDAVFSYIHPQDQSRNARLLSWNTAMAAHLGSVKPDRHTWSSDDEAHVLKLLTGATKDRHLIDTIFPSLRGLATTTTKEEEKKDEGESSSRHNDNGDDEAAAIDPRGLEPWAHCYGGHQFGYYAGQLGDGRAISLYEALAPETGMTWELQLKGAGKTPYSRFADGYAVLRSSIREYLGAEAVAALGVASSRSLSLASTETMVIREEGPEPGAIVCRLAPSWIRFGSFEIFYYRKDYKNLRGLAEYVAKELYGLEDNFETKSSSSTTTTTTTTGEAPSETGKGKQKSEPEPKPDPQRPFIYNRFARMFEQVARRTAQMVSGWQAIGFCHGVINTDNMSILGLTIDYGPFAFLDRYDPTWICNHSDDQGRYMYQSQPGICLWNLTKLALTLESLIGAEDRVDDLPWLAAQLDDKAADETLKGRGSDIVVELLQRGFRDEFLRDYRRRMNDKMGLVDEVRDSDLEDIVVPALAWMDDFEVDYHGFFRQLAQYSTTTTTTTPSSSSSSSTQDQAAHPTTTTLATVVPSREANLAHVREWVQRVLDPLVWQVRGEAAVAQTETWLTKYHERLINSPATTVRGDAERHRRMNQINPAFVLRNWVAQRVIERVTAEVVAEKEERHQDKKGSGGGGSSSSSSSSKAGGAADKTAAALQADRDLLDRVLEMCQNPFGDEAEQEIDDAVTADGGQTCKVVKNNAGLERYGEFIGPVPEWGQGIQCSCSS